MPGATEKFLFNYTRAISSPAVERTQRTPNPQHQVHRPSCRLRMMGRVNGFGEEAPKEGEKKDSKEKEPPKEGEKKDSKEKEAAPAAEGEKKEEPPKEGELKADKTQAQVPAEQASGPTPSGSVEASKGSSASVDSK
ncbi:hypothetical protein COOONC_07624, partial [Cooperia oncophora]